MFFVNLNKFCHVFIQVATDRRVNTEESIWNVEEHNQNISYRKLL